jgi:hypothetical protein
VLVRPGDLGREEQQVAVVTAEQGRRPCRQWRRPRRRLGQDVNRARPASERPGGQVLDFHAPGRGPVPVVHPVDGGDERIREVEPPRRPLRERQRRAGGRRGGSRCGGGCRRRLARRGRRGGLRRLGARAARTDVHAERDRGGDYADGRGGLHGSRQKGIESPGSSGAPVFPSGS